MEDLYLKGLGTIGALAILYVILVTIAISSRPPGKDLKFTNRTLKLDQDLDVKILHSDKDQSGHVFSRSENGKTTRVKIYWKYESNAKGGRKVLRKVLDRRIKLRLVAKATKKYQPGLIWLDETAIGAIKLSLASVEPEVIRGVDDHIVKVSETLEASDEKKDSIERFKFVVDFDHENPFFPAYIFSDPDINIRMTAWITAMTALFSIAVEWLFP